MTEKKVQGDLSSFSIFDITQTLLSGRKTAYVTIESGVRRGYLFFQEGQIVHAVDDQLNAGEGAVFAMFSWRRGTFTLDFDARTHEKNIESSTDFLLLEIARHFDETHRDDAEGGKPAAVQQTVEERLSSSLQSKLTSIFKRVAERSQPAPDRYTKQVFDGLLGPLLETRGTALFLRRGLQPRVKTPDGFVMVKDAVVDEDEVNGFLLALLSKRQLATLRDEKEVSVRYDGGAHGAFRVSVFEEEGAPTILITPSCREIPLLSSFGMGQAADHVSMITDGVVLVSGPLGSGKTSLLASLAAYHVEQRDKFGVVWSSQQLYEFPAGRGFIMRRERSADGGRFADAIRTALDQGADLVAVDPVGEPGELRTLLEVAGTSRLVIATMRALSFGETLSKLQQMTQESIGDRVSRLLSDLLRAVVFLPARRPNEQVEADTLLIGRDEQMLLRKRDFAALRVRQVIR